MLKWLLKFISYNLQVYSTMQMKTSILITSVANELKNNWHNFSGLEFSDTHLILQHINIDWIKGFCGKMKFRSNICWKQSEEVVFGIYFSRLKTECIHKK